MNNITSFIFRLWQTILKFLLGVRQYNGDTSVIYVGEEISMVMANTGNFSFSTRVNRWRGIEQGTVSVQGENIKPEIDLKSTIIYSIIVFISIAIGVVVTTCVSIFTNVSFMLRFYLFVNFGNYYRCNCI